MSITTSNNQLIEHKLVTPELTAARSVNKHFALPFYELVMSDALDDQTHT